MTADEIRAILDPIDATPLECDGFTVVANSRLRAAGGTHVCMEGAVSWRGDGIPFHRWILDGDLVVDYRLRMWLGGDAPHGVFRMADHPDLRYEGQPVAVPDDPRIVEFLMMPWPKEEDL